MAWLRVFKISLSLFGPMKILIEHNKLPPTNRMSRGVVLAVANACRDW